MLVDFIRYSINLLNHGLIVVVTIGLCWKCLQLKLTKTAMHVFFCTLGFMTLLAEGTMARYGGNLLTSSMNADTKTTLHFRLQLIGGLMGIFGTAHKMYSTGGNIKSLHSKLGLAACIFCCIHFMSGALALFSDTYRTYVSALANDFIHEFLSLVLFLTAMVAQFSGYETGFFRRNYKNQKEFYRLLTILIAVLTFIGPFQILVIKFVRLVFY